jgi:antibiotic biosynthesis monooxygenase (ABM) superfamily enzyme
VTTERITSIVRSRARPGLSSQLRALNQRISTVCATFPGYKGTRIIEPADPDAERVIIFSFDSYDNYSRWENSTERRACLLELQDLVEGEVAREHISGLDYWIQPEKKSGGTWPPSWRMTAVAFLAILPLSLFIPPAIKPVFVDSPLLGSVFSIAAVTIAMSYVSLPLMVRVLRKWL